MVPYLAPLDPPLPPPHPLLQAQNIASQNGLLRFTRWLCQTTATAVSLHGCLQLQIWGPFPLPASSSLPFPESNHTWFFDPENVLSTSRYPMPKPHPLEERHRVPLPHMLLVLHTLYKFGFLETVQLFLISCSVGGREDEVDCCATPVRWGKGLAEGLEVGEGVVSYTQDSSR